MNRLGTVLSVIAAGCAAAVVAGAVTGGAARALMRLFVLVDGGVPDFSWSGTLAIAVAFAMFAVPCGIAGAATRRRGVRVAAYVVGTAPIAALAVLIGSGDAADAFARHPAADIWMFVPIIVGLALVVLADGVLADRFAAAILRRRRPAMVHHS